MAENAFNLKKEERLREWRTWLNFFLESYSTEGGEKYTSLKNAAELLNDYYWRLATQFIKPLLQHDGESLENHNIHYYKIISASELTVMVVLPITSDDIIAPEKRSKINAEFAFFVASSIMLNWKINGTEIVDVEDLKKVILFQENIDIKNTKENIIYPDNFRDEHIAWLKELNVHSNLPIISNSQTWRLCYFACSSIRNGGKL